MYTFGSLDSDGFGSVFPAGHALVVLDVGRAVAHGPLATSDAVGMTPLPTALPGPPAYYADLRDGSKHSSRGDDTQSSSSGHDSDSANSRALDVAVEPYMTETIVFSDGNGANVVSALSPKARAPACMWARASKAMRVHVAGQCEALQRESSRLPSRAGSRR